MTKGVYHKKKLSIVKYQDNHRAEVLQWTKEYRENEKISAIIAYGGKCACCGESNIEFLAIDHVEGNGNIKRRNGEPGGWHLARKLRMSGYPQGEYRILCHNCNSSLGYFGYCPHHSNSKFQNVVMNIETRIT
jgi:hypothetical protein